MTVGRLCTREVHLADADESVREAAWRMAQQEVGTLIVLDADGRPSGILTDRDVVVRVIAGGHDPDETTVSRAMTHEPCTVREDLPIEDAIRTMRDHGHRRLPVVDGRGRLVGVLSMSDLLELLGEEMEEIRELSHRSTSRRG